MNLLYLWSKLLKKIRGVTIINSCVHSTAKIESGSHIVSSSFDRYSFCGYDCEIVNTVIGSFCSIANNVVIGGAMHPVDWVSMSPVFYEGRDSVKRKFSKHKRGADKRTYIGHDVWIGQGALIKQGVRIGTGAVVGMGAVVTKNVADYEIVAGNPARLIKKRFDDELICALLKTAWWNFSDDRLNELGRYFNDPVDFLKHI